jgi:hypothetical protein
MDIAEAFALVESDAIALVWDTPIVAKTSAKKTYKHDLSCDMTK